MAGMFYSLEETAEKLNMSEEAVKKLVEERKLREFRDGSNVLFKVSEVDALLSDTGLAAEAPVAEAQEEELNLEPLESEAAGEEELNLEPQAEGEEEFSFEPEESAEEPSAEPEAMSELAGEAEQKELSLDDSLALLGGDEELGQAPAEDDSLGFMETEEEPKEEKSETKEDTELSFALDEPEKSDTDLTDADTAITREGISVLDESDSEFKLSDDTAAETKAMQEASSLEQIEGDLNLDTFGSGSGLLDLSLQADDTSLGGILDEIYTPPADEGAAPAAAASAADVAAEAESILAQEGLAAAPAMAQAYVEPEADSSSNIFGFLLLLPLFVVIYTLLVTVAGQFGVLSSLVPTGMITIYTLVGVGILGLAIAGYAWMQGAPAKPKQPKPKKEKAPKVKKEKPPKVKKEKPKKEKKGKRK